MARSALRFCAAGCGAEQATMGSSNAQLRLRHHSTVESFEPRCLMTAETGDFHLDYRIEEQFHPENITSPLGINDLTGLTSARANYGLTGAGQTVVVIDSGIAWDHAALGGGFGSGYRVVGGWDFTEENDGNPYDDGPAGSHGTHVAGIIGSSNTGALGLAPGVDLVGLRVFNDQGVGYFHWIEQSLQWVHNNRNAFRNPITTVNLSIGMAWNGTTVPAWSSIEDELAQLKADGIFISVAAGNSFTDHNQTGLSYPAASSSVVPVSSVDDNGSISYYSQRESRVIAAPGRAILSTVPDYVGNFNGRTDDWASYSGTSMAAPYVAGASVLIRQAMQLAGQANITQDSIYQLMRQTGDVIFDSTTNQNYVRLNVGRALDAVLADDVGSSVTTARQLGATSSATVTGLIGRQDDRDYFTFTATQSGRARLTATPSGNLTTVWNLANGQTRAGNELVFDTVAGQSYTVGISSSSGLGQYALALTIEPSVVSWGVIDFCSADGQQVSGERSIGFTAAYAGIFTVEAAFSHAAGNVDIEVYNGSEQLVSSSSNSSNRERVDVNVTAGSTYRLRLRGTNNDVDLRFTNLVAVNGTSVTIHGTAGQDTFSFSAGASHQFSIKETSYQFTAGAVSSVQFVANDTNDRAYIRGTSANESLVLSPGSSQFLGAGWSASVVGCGYQSIDGGGGQDSAKVYDSAGDDMFVSTPIDSTLVAANTTSKLFNFSSIDAHSVAGGRDLAVFFDSAGDDMFVGTPWQSVMRGSAFEHRAHGFDKTEALSISGGRDLAVFHDSAGNDMYVGTPQVSLMQGSGFENTARGFGQTIGCSFSGGSDLAVLFDSAGDDMFVGTAGRSLLRGSGFENTALSFVRTEARSHLGGRDLAVFYDSDGDDMFVGTPRQSLLRGGGYENSAHGFDESLAQSIYGGKDIAVFFDSAGDDVFRSAKGFASLNGTSFQNSARGFQTVHAICNSGGVDVAILDDTSGNDALVGEGTTARLTAQDYEVLARGFQTVRAQGTSGVNSLSLRAIDFVLHKAGTWVAANF